MLRRIFTVASALSLLLCVGAIVLCVRSFWAADGRSLASPDLGDKGFDVRFLFSARGTLGYRMWRIEEQEIPADPSVPANAGLISLSYVGIQIHAENADSPRAWFWTQDPVELLSLNGSLGATPEPGKRQVNVSALGFLFRRLDTSDPYTPAAYSQSVLHYADRVVGIPHWLVAGLAAIMPVAWLRRARICRRLVKGLCVQCGFDLRATPDRCPECGTPVRKAPRTTT